MLLCTVIMVAVVYIVAWTVLVFNKMNPHEKNNRAFIDDHDSDEDEESARSKSSRSGHSIASPRGEGIRKGLSSLNMPMEGTSSWRTTHVSLSADELIGDIGVSAMCVLNANEPSSVTRIPNKVAVPFVALQSMCLQIGLLYFLTLQLVPNNNEPRALPASIVCIAIYLHFLNCIQEFPYSYQLFIHLPDFHDSWWDLAGLGTVLISDAFIIPLLSFVLGALYLCTSRTIGDAILNAVAVAFIREIDNWILSLNAHTDRLSGKVKSAVVHIPVNRTMMRQIAWGIIFVPVVPILCTAGMCYIGFVVLGL